MSIDTRRLAHFVTASLGTEDALADELAELGCAEVEVDGSGVRFVGTEEQAQRVCFLSRIGVRVLRPLGEFPCRNGDALYEGVRSVDWRPYLTPRHTLAVSSNVRDSALTHTVFVSQRTKDAVVDQLRDRQGTRPSVDRDDPDLAIVVRIVRDRATVLVDVSGESLHLRGYRPPGGVAPLKETLAAAIVRMSGWDRSSPLVDPMCGTGTIAVEADHWARRVAPGLSRARFGFERWASFDESAARRLADVRGELAAAELAEGPPIVASDVDAAALELAKRSVATSRARVRVERVRVGALRSTDPPGWIVANTPYGERVDMDPSLAREIGRGLSALSPGHHVALLVRGRPKVGAPASARRARVFNGPLECSLLTWSV
jgi:putative N6-adenine-specific DNA methylase